MKNGTYTENLTNTGKSDPQVILLETGYSLCFVNTIEKAFR